jgi:hypothetical protein
MKKILLGLLIFNMLTFCSSKNDQLETNGKTDEKGIEEEREEKNDPNEILGVWSDGTGPNASFRIEKDSIYDVEHFERTRYQLKDDSLTIFYPDEPFKAKILKINQDSLIYESQYGITKFWRFRD